jgi:hypothetical protein
MFSRMIPATREDIKSTLAAALRHRGTDANYRVDEKIVRAVAGKLAEALERAGYRILRPEDLPLHSGAQLRAGPVCMDCD